MTSRTRTAADDRTTRTPARRAGIPAVSRADAGGRAGTRPPAPAGQLRPAFQCALTWALLSSYGYTANSSSAPAKLRESGLAGQPSRLSPPIFQYPVKPLAVTAPPEATNKPSTYSRPPDGPNVA